MLHASVCSYTTAKNDDDSWLVVMVAKKICDPVNRAQRDADTLKPSTQFETTESSNPSKTSEISVYNVSCCKLRDEERLSHSRLSNTAFVPSKLRQDLERKHSLKTLITLKRGKRKIENICDVVCASNSFLFVPSRFSLLSLTLSKVLSSSPSTVRCAERWVQLPPLAEQPCGRVEFTHS